MVLFLFWITQVICALSKAILNSPSQPLIAAILSIGQYTIHFLVINEFPSSAIEGDLLHFLSGLGQ